MNPLHNETPRRDVAWRGAVTPHEEIEVQHQPTDLPALDGLMFDDKTIEHLTACLKKADDAADELGGEAGAERLTAAEHLKKAKELDDLTIAARAGADQWRWLLAVARANRAAAGAEATEGEATEEPQSMDEDVVVAAPPAQEEWPIEVHSPYRTTDTAVMPALTDVAVEMYQSLGNGAHAAEGVQ